MSNLNLHHILSKSSFLRGLQCEKSLYLNKYYPELKDELPASKQAIFNTGYQVGNLAQQLFPGGVNAGFEITGDGQKSVKLTEQYINEEKKVIYEAAFQYEGVLVISDIIVKSDKDWHVYEVKSSASLADYHINDTAIQYYILTKYGIEVEDIYVIYLNNKYVRQGDIDINKLFTIESVKEKVLDIQEFTESSINKFKKLLSEKFIPEIDIGPHCNDPFKCDFYGHCWKDIPDYSVFDLSRFGNKAFELYKKGITEIKDIPDDLKLSVNQQIERRCYVDNKIYLNKVEIRKFLNTLKYPLYFMDFESIQPAIPMYDNSRPYQQIVFQYSVYYKLTKESEPVHYEYLGDGKSDPRERFIKNLISDTGKSGIILVYNASFEKSRLRELAENFPEYKKEINKIISRIIDLMTPFKNRLYYKSEMKSRHSLKNVLPALNPEYGYSNLEIKEGGQAGAEYLKMMAGSDDNEIKQIRKNLLEYCGMDTYGMIMILNELEKVVS